MTDEITFTMAPFSEGAVVVLEGFAAREATVALVAKGGIVAYGKVVAVSPGDESTVTLLPPWSRYTTTIPFYEFDEVMFFSVPRNKQTAPLVIQDTSN